MQSTTSFVGKNGKAWTDQFYEASMGPFIKKSLYRQWKNKDGYYDCRGWMYKVDQKEIEKIKNEYKLLAEPNKFISTNDILVHWMFSFNKKADWVIVAVDMRPRLESLKKSKSFLAGNYLACPALRPEDISSPENIRKAMNDIFAKKYNNGYLDVPTGKQLMKYNSGTSTNWCKFYKEVELPGFKLEYCVPHFSTKFEKVSGVIPTMEETIIIFKMNSVDIGVNVLSASGRITSEMLDDKTKSPVLGECIMPELNYHRQPGAFQ